MIVERSSRGQMMLIVLFVVFILMGLAFTAISVETMDSRGANQEYNTLYSLNLARSGLVVAMSQLRNNYTWGTGGPITQDLQGGSCTITVFAPAGNATSWDKLWKVTSSGTFRGCTRTVTAWLHLESFARFAYFTSADVGSDGNPIYFVSSDRITGPTHTNGYFSIAGRPQFSHTVTSANVNDPFLYGGQYHQGGTTTGDKSRYYHYYTGYSTDAPMALNYSPTFSFAGGQSPVDLPDNSLSVKNAANINLTGNATLIFSAAGIVTVRQAGYSDRAYSTAKTTIYVNNGTASVSGTVNGNVTVGASNGIVVTDNLTYHDRTTDTLGLVSDTNVTVSPSGSTQRDISIDAAIMALNGSFTVSGYNNGSYRGYLHIFGGITQQIRGAVGTFNGQGQIVSGYAKDYT